MYKRPLLLLILILFSPLSWSKRHSFSLGGRSFILAAPDKPQTSPRPLLVLLHGCKQNPTLMLDGTQLEEEAKKKNFYILVPEQPNFYNIDHCWNWFLEFQQKRLPYTEMSQIISGIEYVSALHAIDRNKVFVAGISAGGVMAHSLTVCYPDYFSGSAIHSGLNYKVAENIVEAQTVLTSFKQKSPEYLGEKMFECSRKVSKSKLNKLLIIHGDQDSRVPLLHALLISASGAVWQDYLDDGQRNDSVRGEELRKKSSFANSFQVEQTDTQYPNLIERRLIIKGLGHAWGGGKPVSVNFDPKAPSSNKFILDFFQL